MNYAAVNPHCRCKTADCRCDHPESTLPPQLTADLSSLCSGTGNATFAIREAVRDAIDVRPRLPDGNLSLPLQDCAELVETIADLKHEGFGTGDAVEQLRATLNRLIDERVERAIELALPSRK